MLYEVITAHLLPVYACNYITIHQAQFSKNRVTLYLADNESFRFTLPEIRPHPYLGQQFIEVVYGTLQLILASYNFV